MPELRDASPPIFLCIHKNRTHYAESMAHKAEYVPVMTMYVTHLSIAPSICALFTDDGYVCWLKSEVL